jgi:hypothetical protein
MQQVARYDKNPLATEDRGCEGYPLVVDRRRRAGQMVYLVHFQQDGLHYIVPDQLKVDFAQQMCHIVLAASEKAV